MSKVKVSKEVFDALESTKEWKIGCESWVSNLLRHQIGNMFLNERAILNDLDLNYFCEILTKGYELELTPHEKVKKIFDENINTKTNDEDSSIFRIGISEGILSTLEALGEKVEGVNK